MAREFSRVNTAIWGDPEFRKLHPLAQQLYLMLWTSPHLSYAGTHDWRPGRLAAQAQGWSTDDVEVISMQLAARHFVVIDHGTEEILLRSWLKFDGILKQPRMAISAINAYSGIYSEKIRKVFVWELNKIKQFDSTLSCWEDERVDDVLSHPSFEGKDWVTPSDPFAPGFTLNLTSALGLA